MRHVILTCQAHPALRWSCKACAVNADGTYNGSRNIVFNGEPTGKGMYSDGSGLQCSRYFAEREQPIVQECECPASMLTRAPEDVLVRLYGEHDC